ncbi:MAG: hypothetical protein ACI8QC_004361 [Planctomycetota bacterium]|jgi:hypothetical protein
MHNRSPVMEPVSNSTRLDLPPVERSDSQAVTEERAPRGTQGSDPTAALPRDIRALLAAALAAELGGAAKGGADTQPAPSSPLLADALGPLLAALTGLTAANPAAGQAGEAAAGLDAALVARLQELVFQPGMDATDLRRVAALTAQVPPEMMGGTGGALAVQALVALVESQLSQGVQGEQGLFAFEVAGTRVGLGQAVEAVLTGLRVMLGKELPNLELLRSLGPEFQARLAPAWLAAEGPSPWTKALAQLPAGSLMAGREGALLRAMHSGADPAQRRIFQRLAGQAQEANMGARLDAAMVDRPAGAATEMLDELRHALELDRFGVEQRQRVEHTLNWSLLVPDDAGWAAMELAMGQRKRGANSDEEADGTYRVVLATNLSGLGPLRADVLVGPGRIAVRLEVERPETAQALRQVSARLEASLAAENQRVVIAVVDSPGGLTPVAPPKPQPATPAGTGLLDVRA